MVSVPSQAAVMARLKQSTPRNGGSNTMDTSTFDFDTLTLVVTIVGSMLTIVILMYRQFNHFDKKFDRKFDDLNTKVGQLETTIAPIDARFDGIDTRFDGIDTRFDGIDARFDGVDTRFDGVDRRFDKLEARFDAMGRDVSDARERLARIEGYLMGPESLGPKPSPAPPDGLGDDHRQAG